MPKLDELLFALKTFAGAMAALYLAFWLGLDNPYWAMATAYIVAQPFTGAMRSKAVYRFFGTLTGGVAAVALVPNLVDAPVLLSLAMAIWVGACLYFSLLDRTPRAYMFMLAGYSAGIIGFPAVLTPQNIFEIALTRVEEISLGIICTTVVGTIVFPRPLGPVLARRIVGWVKPGIDWAEAALAGHEEDKATFFARRRLATEAVDIAMMETQLAYDTSHLQSAVAHVTKLRLYMLSMMPVVASIGDRVGELKRLGGITPHLQDVLDDVGRWIRVGGPERSETIRARIATLAEDQISWCGLLRASLAVRLEELVHMMRHARILRRHVLKGDPAAPAGLKDADFVAVRSQARDHGLAALSGLAAAVAILVICTFWIATAWPAGAGAAVIGAVACSFFAAMDDPAPAIALMLRNALIATLGAGAYSFLILPRVTGFDEIALVLLPAALVIGVLVSRPATFATGMVMGAIGGTNLALENGYRANFDDYLNSTLALVLGLAIALVVTRLIRSVGAAWSARRLLRAGWRDVAAAATLHGAHDRARLTGVMIDRLGLLMPRLAAVSPGADLAAADMLKDLRVGLNALGLQAERHALPPGGQRATARVLERVAAHYRDDPLRGAPLALLDDIDDAIRCIAHDARTYKETLMLLSGLRIALFARQDPPDVERWGVEPPMRQLA